jgi:hypothetical protein
MPTLVGYSMRKLKPRPLNARSEDFFYKITRKPRSIIHSRLVFSAVLSPAFLYLQFLPATCAINKTIEFISRLSPTTKRDKPEPY